MSPEFDPKKNEANIAKHGVSLSRQMAYCSTLWQSRSRIVRQRERNDTLRSV